MNLSILCTQTIEIAKIAAKFILEESEKLTPENVEIKGLHNFVTHVDKGAEQIIVKGLQRILPEAGFIAEEGTESDQSHKELVWIIDPIDGTTNFIHKLPPYAISIALAKGDEILLGVVYEITQKECFYSWQGAPCYMNGKVVNVSKEAELKNAFIATGFPYDAYDRMEAFMKSLEYFFRYTPGVRRIGSAATDLAYVACGRFDAFYEYNLSPWDVAAGAFLVQQAGGTVSDFHGGDKYLFGRTIVASNPNVYDPFLTAVQKFLVHNDF